MITACKSCPFSMRPRISSAVLSIGMALAILAGTSATSQAVPLLVGPPVKTSELTEKIVEAILNHGETWSNLGSFVSKGPRLCGSTGADQAVDWAKSRLTSYGFERISTQSVKVPHWVRGTREVASITSGASPVSLRVTALGQSAGTPAGGIEAEVVEVKSLDEVRKLGSKLRGKIVFYNRPMNPAMANTFEAYGAAVDQRSSGPALAARNGAVATLVRSMTTLADDAHPHTGITFFGNTNPIPAAAISTHDANVLAGQLQGRAPVRVRLELSAKRLPDTTSYNVMGEITGAEIPQEIVLVGGHLDSWDLSSGAHDDGAGVVQSIEVLRAFKALGLRPKRTVRVVLFMCEEFGGIGAEEYAAAAKSRSENHIFATESDRGGFRAEGFSIENASPAALKKIQGWAPYLASLQATSIIAGSSGTDVEPLNELGAVTLDLLTESRHYFDFHHSDLDEMQVVNPKELSQGAAALAVITFLAADQGL
ncbi:MAG: M20/M25/M40 family metallo-hydrolase [Methylotenera sp.]|nr:M20/M25/M40 family metallo-hydrolase [Oligoflexia bacterium]